MVAMPFTPTPGNVLKAYRRATEQHRQDGTAWYSTAHAAAVRLDPDNPRRAAGVIAALSPRTDWERNLRLAERAFADGRATGTLGRSCDQANAILGGGDPAEVLTGPKVRAFFTLIADPANPEAVCVDRHAVDVAIGHRLDEADRSAWYPLGRRGLYEVFAGCYRRASARLGVSPGQVQAVTWVAWRDWAGGTR